MADLIVRTDTLKAGLDERLRSQVLQDMVGESFVEALLRCEIDPRFVGLDSSVISNWVQINTKDPKNHEAPFNFEQREFQRQILDDPAKHVVIMKSAQMGISEIMIRECIARLAIHNATKALYIFPTLENVQVFSDSRISLVMENATGIKGKLKGVDNQGRKRIGDSFMIIRGGFKYSHAQMIDADFLYIDEYERHKQELIPVFQERLAASIYKIKRYFSTPERKGEGIDALYEASDQKAWFDLCPSCGHEEVIDEPNIVRKETDTGPVYSYNCSACHGVYAPEKRKGFWKATKKNPDLPISGYHISQFMSSTVSADEMVVAKATTIIPGDYDNLKRGRGVRAGMTEEQMGKAQIGHHVACLDGNFRGQAIMAVDWGKPWSWAEVSIGDEEKRLVTWIEAFYSERPSDHAKRMIEVAFRSGAGMIIADAGYGHDRNEVMKEALGDKFWDIMTNSEILVDPRFDFKKRHVTWGKLRMIKTHYGLLRQKRVILPCESPLIELDTQTKLPAHRIWLDHHDRLSIIPVRNEKRVLMIQGAMPMMEEIKAAGSVHLAMVSSYADVLFLLSTRMDELKRKFSGRPMRVVTV